MRVRVSVPVDAPAAVAELHRHDPRGGLARLRRRVHPRQVQVVAAAVVDVAVVADPAERRARVVLTGLGPLGEAVDVVPRATRRGDDVEREADRVLAADGVPAHLLARGDGHLVVLEDEPAARVQDEPDVEVAVLPVRVPRLGLGDDEHVVLARDLAERLRLLAGDIDRALPGEGGVVEVQDLVVERLERALGKRDQPHRDGQAREPRGGLHQVVQVLDVDLDVASLPDPAHRRDESDRHVGLDHPSSLPQTRRG